MKLKVYKKLFLSLGLLFPILCFGQSTQIQSPSGSGSDPNNSDSQQNNLSSSQSLIKFPSTYGLVREVSGDPNFSKVVSYFIFKSEQEVIWCLESSDDFLFAIAYGVYNKSNQTIVFSNKKVYSSLTFFQEGDIIFNLKKIDNELYISTNGNVSGFIGYKKGMWQPLEKLPQSIVPSDALVGTSWEASGDKWKNTLYFKSESEVILDAKPRTYILIGDKLGILSGDNPTKEAIVGNFEGDILHLHRSGYRDNLNYPWYEFKRIED